MRRGMRWGFPTSALVGLLIAGCNSAASSPGTATYTGGGATSASRTIDTGGKSTISRTVATQSSSSTLSTSSSSSSLASSSKASGPEWEVKVESYPVPDSLAAVSPAGDGYATYAADNVCLNTWDGQQVGCPVNVPGSARVFVTYSAEGSYLAVVATGTDGLSTVYMVPLATGTATVLTGAGFVPAAGVDPGTILHPSVSSAVWDDKEQIFYLQQNPAAGAATGDLLVVPPAGGSPGAIPVPADVASSSPSMWATTDTVLYAPNTGAQVGTLWQLRQGATSQVGGAGKNYAPGGSLALIAMDNDGAYAMFCSRTGDVFGALYEIDLSTGDDYEYLKDDEGCLGAAYSIDANYVAVVGPINQSLVVTVLSTTADEVPANQVLNGSTQKVPAQVTWTSGDVLTILESDLTDKLAKISVVKLFR